MNGREMFEIAYFNKWFKVEKGNELPDYFKIFDWDILMNNDQKQEYCLCIFVYYNSINRNYDIDSRRSIILSKVLEFEVIKNQEIEIIESHILPKLARDLLEYS